MRPWLKPKLETEFNKILTLNISCRRLCKLQSSLRRKLVDTLYLVGVSHLQEAQLNLVGVAGPPRPHNDLVAVEGTIALLAEIELQGFQKNENSCFQVIYFIIIS